MRRSLAVASLLLSTILCAAPAQAQCRSEVRFIPDISGQTGGSLGLVPVCDGKPSGSAKTKKKAAKERKPTAKQLRTLRYKRSEAVSAKVREQMIGRLAYGDGADAVRAEIGSGTLMRQFNGAVRSVGWSTSDLADMYAQAYIVMWLVVNPKQDSTSKAVDRAVRSDIRQKLGLDAKFRRMSDARQQELAEWLGSWAVVFAGSINALRERGQSEAVSELRDEVRTMARRSELLGVDLSDVKLTRKGIRDR